MPTFEITELIKGRPKKITSSEEIEAAKESVVETTEDEDYVINPKVSVDGNVITVDADVKSDKFTSADTYDAAKKELSNQGYTCK